MQITHHFLRYFSTQFDLRSAGQMITHQEIFKSFVQGAGAVVNTNPRAIFRYSIEHFHSITHF